MAANEIAAWPVMALKPGMTGLGGEDDFEVVSTYDDDGTQRPALRKSINTPNPL